MAAVARDEQHRCPAHGKTVAEHIDEYANDCTRLPPFDLEVQRWPDGCPSCSTYAETGMHWDTCAYRGRNLRDADEYAASVALQHAERTKPAADDDPELHALAEIVAALAPLGAAQRARVMRYLSNRYERTEQPDAVRVVRLLQACDAEENAGRATITTSRVRGLLA